MTNHKHKIRHLFFPLLGIAFFIGAFIHQTTIALSWGHDSWQITEWLINYQGGFVRRGLPGELIFRLSSHIGIGANVIAVILSLVIFFIIFILLFIKVRNYFSIAFLLSPVVLGSAAYQNFIVRKDGLGVLCFILCLLVSKKIGSTKLKFITLNLISSFAIVSHESFIFFGIPAILIVNTEVHKFRFTGYLRELFSTSLKLFPTFLIFFITAYAHGTKETAILINQSLLDLWFQIEPNNPCNCFLRPGGSIDALQWSTSQGLSLSRSLVHAYSHGIWVPLAWIITIAICFFITINFYREIPASLGVESNSLDRKLRLITSLLFQLLVIFPLFILGWDFGRWIFIWITSSIAFFAFNNESLPTPLELLSTKIRGALTLGFPYYKLNYWPLLFIGIPECCWSVYKLIQSMPLGYYIDWINPNILNFLK